MDPEAAARARRRQIKADLTQATTDEEASPPEWVDLITQIDDGAAAVRAGIESSAGRFVAEPDIRRALAARERDAERLRERTQELNRHIRRLNLIAPLARFHRPELDPDEILRPLYRARRNPG